MLLKAPILVANLIFAQRFRDVAESVTAFGANLLVVLAVGAAVQRYVAGMTSPMARRMARTTSSIDVVAIGAPIGPLARKSRSMVVISSQNRIPPSRNPPAPAATSTRVGPNRPRENIGTTMRSSRNVLRTSSETTSAGRGWCGSSG
jgi:hypothetical protein